MQRCSPGSNVTEPGNGFSTHTLLWLGDGLTLTPPPSLVVNGEVLLSAYYYQSTVHCFTTTSPAAAASAAAADGMGKRGRTGDEEMQRMAKEWSGGMNSGNARTNTNTTNQHANVRLNDTATRNVGREGWQAGSYIKRPPGAKKRMAAEGAEDVV